MSRSGFAKCRAMLGLTALLGIEVSLASGPAVEPLDAKSYKGYLLSAPQIEDTLRPLQYTVPSRERRQIHAATVSVADPIETHLARMFDIQVASLLRAFHSRGYVLDAYAFPWNPDLAGRADQGKRIPKDGSRSFGASQRSMPGVLVFRNDQWRIPFNSKFFGVSYVILFLVGESPTFGVQPIAFATALQCAAALNTFEENPDVESAEDVVNEDCTALFRQRFARSDTAEVSSDSEDTKEDNKMPTLEIVGPTFSGSMQSLVLAVSSIPELVGHHIEITSPSATVKSNEHVVAWANLLLSSETRKSVISYNRLAATLDDQLLALCRDIPVVDEEQGNIVVLAEESTFGRGVSDLMMVWESSELQNCCTSENSARNPETQPEPPACKNSDACIKSNCASRIRVMQFPQNIAAIRAERSVLSQQESANLKRLTRASGKLLELDLSKMDETTDRPPPYSRALTTRSDELMLYGTFDALKAYVKPVAVAIVATDIRDRLFLLNEVRKNLPKALPVLMEMDFLTAHPDYRKISRGSVVIPNASTLLKLDMEHDYCVLTAQGRGPNNTAYYSFPSDYSANMFRAASGLINVFEHDGLAGRDGYCGPDKDSASPDTTENGLEENASGEDFPANSDPADECSSNKCLPDGDSPDEGLPDERSPDKVRRLTAPLVTTMAGFQAIEAGGAASHLIKDFRKGWSAARDSWTEFYCRLPENLEKLWPGEQDWGSNSDCSSRRATSERDAQRNWDAAPHSRLLAADSRLYLELPAYLFLLVAGLLLSVMAWWLVLHCRRYTIMLSPLSRLNATGTIRQPGTVMREEGTPEALSRAWLPALVLTIPCGALLGIAFLRLTPVMYLDAPHLAWDLPHGRDEWALLCLFLIYLAMAIIGIWRLHLWRLRVNEFLGKNGDWRRQILHHRGETILRFSRFESLAWLAISIPLFALVLLGVIRFPIAVDSLKPPGFMSMLVLPLGAWFLGELWRQWGNWSHLGMVLGKTMKPVSQNIFPAGSDHEEWPSPLELGERPQSPFSLKFRRQDLDALEAGPGRAAWVANTRQIVHGKGWPFGEGKSHEFLCWQAQLVAEMRFASVAVRTCAWCAILAPTIVLASMTVYPAPWERLQTVVSVGLLIASFMLVMFVVLRLEQHPLLSRMFTLHSDRLSLGGALGALWPKLIAAVIILVPVLFPDFLEWFYEMLRSINSLK